MDRTNYEALMRAPAEGYETTRGTQSQERGRERAPEREGRLGGLQDRVSDILSIRSVDDLTHQVRQNPLGTLALAAGIGYALQRTHLVEGVLGAVISPIFRDEESADRWDRDEGDLSPAEERLLAWLNDAYAFEQAQIPILENHADDARRHPHVRRKDLEHLEKTKRHVKRVKECIRMLGEKPSKVKGAIGRIGGAFDALATEPFDDEVVRNFVMDFGAENMEIMSYRAIITAANEAGHRKIARICEEILEEEEEMADWLKENISGVVRITLDDLRARSGTTGSIHH